MVLRRCSQLVEVLAVPFCIGVVAQLRDVLALLFDVEEAWVGLVHRSLVPKSQGPDFLPRLPCLLQ